MSEDGRPPDFVGGRLAFTPGAYGFAYSSSFVATVAAVAKVLQAFGFGFPPADLCCASFLLALLPVWVVAAIEAAKPLRRLWKRRLIRSANPGWYAAGVGATAGAVAGALLSVFSALSKHRVDLAVYLFIACAGPAAGVCWIIRPTRRGRRSEAADYDELG